MSAAASINGVEYDGNSDQMQEFPAVQMVIRSIECPICLEVPLPPERIYQCEEGHIICGKCKLIGRGCSCQSPWTNKRNFALEDIIAASLFKCKFDSEGCGEILIGRDHETHIKACKYRPLVCNIKAHRACSNNIIPVTQFLEHVRDFHLIAGQIHSIEDGNKFAFQVNPHHVNGIQLAYMVYDDKPFLLHSFASSTNMWLWVIAMDNSDVSSEYQVDVCFFKRALDCRHKRITQLIPVQPIRSSFRSIMDNFDYADFPRWQTNKFLERDWNSIILPFVCTIEKNRRADRFLRQIENIKPPEVIDSDCIIKHCTLFVQGSALLTLVFCIFALIYRATVRY